MKQILVMLMTVVVFLSILSGLARGTEDPVEPTIVVASLAKLGPSDPTDRWYVAIDYHNGSFDRMYINGTMSNPSLTITEAQTVQSSVLNSAASQIVQQDLLLGFSYSWRYTLEFWGYSVGVFDFNLGVRMPVRVQLQYASPMIRGVAYPIYATLTPLDWPDFNEFTCNFHILGASVFDVSRSFVTPLGQENALSFALGPYWFWYGIPLPLCFVDAGLTIMPKLFSGRVEAQSSISGDGVSLSPKIVTWNSPSQTQEIDVLANDVSPLNYASIVLSQFKLYLNKLLVDVNLNLKAHYWWGGVGQVDIRLFTVDASTFLPSLALGIHPSSPASFVEADIPVNKSPLFDDGFESGSFSKWSGTSITSGETLSVKNTRSHSGSYSANFASNGSGGIERAYAYETWPSSGELYARGYFYVSQSGIVENDDRFYFIVFSAGSNNVAFAGWRAIGGVVRWNLLIRNGTGWVSICSTLSPSLNKWYCVELHWKKDATNGLGQLWVDGAQVCSASGRNTALYGEISSVQFGLAELYNCGSTAVYADCAKIATIFIGPEPVGTVFGNGFESGSFSAWTGTSFSLGETRTVVTTPRRSGSYSARFTSNGGGGTEYSYGYENTSSSGELYARGYFYVSQSGIVENDDRFYFIVFSAGSNNVAFAGWRAIGGVVRWNLLIRNGTGWVSICSTLSPSLNKWYCVELHWKKDATNGAGELWVDGLRVCSATSRNTASYGDVSQVRFGLAELRNCAPTTIYCDDCMISKTNIGT